MGLIHEVGLKRIIRYFIFTFWQGIFNCLGFSPLRICWLRLGGAKIGHHCFIDALDFFNLDRTGLPGLKIGHRCFLGRGVLIDTAGKVTLGDWVTIAPRAIILSHLSVGFAGHPLLKKYPKSVGHTQINSGSFVGTGAIITHHVTIGAKSLIAAGAVVTKNISARSLAAGVPARLKQKL